ncbi:hypothetical protein BDV38DRAFT_250813 [Aspergillus pseudotamarii]|uniref:Uncharacterized protein n=1 Tax=Aspergillus pseudotamarii TaxID=132259 RepID=A0A5N6SS68_ASPPS|nr:uncharacterized protein BDV38DRAFT_250813 [Aspergillus pseudotamarii]KAE8135984.1 hypothetical protein BDV38DRAFT_250813 [Aspergillus pseudotamarii]
MRPFDIVLFSLAASAAPIDGTTPEFTCNGDVCYLPPPKPVEPTYFLENGEQVPDISHFPPPPRPTPTNSEEAKPPTDLSGSGGSGSSVGSIAGGVIGAGAALGGVLGAAGSAGSAASGALGGVGAAGAAGAVGSPEAPGNAGNAGSAGDTASTGATGAAGADGVSYGTFEGDVSELPPPKKPVETYFDENLQEIPGPNGDERTFELNVHGEGEGALNGGGNPGRGRPGPSRAGPSQSRGINLNDFRDSDKSIARHYLQSENSPHVKPFDGGRTPDEKKLFASVRERYTNLKEVKATSDKEGNFAARDRGRYRYIAGTKDGKEVLVGIAEHGTNSNNFVNFTPFPKPQ